MAFFISFLTGVILFYSFHYFPFTSSFISLLSLIFLILKRKYLIIPVIAIGIIYALFRYTPEPDFSHITGKEILVSGMFGSEAVKTSSEKFMQTLIVKSALDAESGRVLKELGEKEINIFSDTELMAGTRYWLNIKVGKDRTRLNPGGIKSGEIYATLIEVKDIKEADRSLYAGFQDARAGLNQYINKAFNRDSGALLSAITTGQRAYMSEELRDVFNATGLAHILSISGTHFGLFSVLLFGVFRFIIRALPYRVLQRFTIYLTPSQGAAILSLPFMLAYLGLSGGSIPAVRSFIMISLFLGGLVIGRKGFWLNSLLFAAFILVLWEPAVLFSLSFQLSFLAVLFIGFSLGDKEDEKENGNKVLRYLKNTVLLTLAASIGTAPLVAYHFHYFSVISPVSNLFVTPLIGFILVPLSLIASFIFLMSGHYILNPVIAMVSDSVISVVRFLASISFADMKIPSFPTVILVFFYAGFLLYQILRKKVSPENRRFFWEKVKYMLVIPFIPILIYTALTLFSPGELRVTYIDVGQGDSAVVEFLDGKTLIIDTGRSGKEAASYLKNRGKKTIDALILSHMHPDHTGGAEYLLRHFEVKEVWDNGRLIYPDGFLDRMNHRSLERGDVIEGRGYRIYVLHPYKEFYTMEGNEYVEANNDSLVLKLEGKRASFLFPGDVEEEAEENMVYLGKWLKSDVIKVPHHGGRTSSYGPFLATVSPDVAVISTGRGNTFGHPHQETLEILQGVKIYRTDRDGAVSVKETEGGLEIMTYKDFQFEKASSFNKEWENIKRLFMVW